MHFLLSICPGKVARLFLGRTARKQCVDVPVSNMVTERRLRFFGHIARGAPGEDHHLAVAAVIRKPQLEVCMGMGKTGIPWVPWDSHGNGNKISHGMGMGWEWE